MAPYTYFSITLRRNLILTCLLPGAPPVLEAAQVHGASGKLQLRRGARPTARLLARRHRRRRHQRGQRHAHARYIFTSISTNHGAQ